jgi:hypothetical protein
MSDFQVDLRSIFEKLSHENYCLVKMPDKFPQLLYGEDLDIFCYDIDSVASSLLQSLNGYITDNLTLKIEKFHDRAYVDVIENSKIKLRFDLYGALPEYKNVNLKPSFFSCIMEGKITETIGSIIIYRPSVVDECILRYIEYHEWYADRPDKIKHIDYIYRQLEEENLIKTDLLSKLHYYTQIPGISVKHINTFRLLPRISQIIPLTIQVVLSMKQNGFRKTCVKILEKIF